MSTPEEHAFADLYREADGTWDREQDGRRLWAEEAAPGPDTPAPPVPLPEGVLPLTDAHLKAAMRRALLWVFIFGFALAALVLLVVGWHSAALVLVGAAISATGLWEWQKLATLIQVRLAGGKAHSTARVIVGFFLRLAIAAVVLYVSLKSLHGSVFALLGGLLLAVLALGIEAVRLVRAP